MRQGFKQSIPPNTKANVIEGDGTDELVAGEAQASEAGGSRHAFYGDSELVFGFNPLRVIQGDAPPWVRE